MTNKLTKYGLMIIAAVLLVAMAFAGTASAADNWIDYADTDWYDSEGIEFTLTTPQELAGLAKKVNDSVTFAGKTVKLGADIDLGGKEWTPIGGNVTEATLSSSFKYFDGMFDGCEFIISGLEVNKPMWTGVGLFGAIGSDSEIKNVNLVAKNVSGSRYVGSLVGIAYGGSNIHDITACVDNVTAVNSGLTSCGGNVGGLIGRSGSSATTSDIVIKDVQITVNNLVSGTASPIGGLIAQFSGVIENAYVILNSAKGSTFVGGIIGSVSGTATLNNSMVVILNEINQTATGDSKIGGLVGMNSNADKIDSCIVIGGNVVSSAGNTGAGTGGILGGSGKTVNISNTVSLSKTINRALLMYTGRIFGSGTVQNVINNYAWDGMLVNGNYVSGGNLNNKDGANVSSGILWDNQSFFEETLGWDFINTWEISTAENFKLPVLKGRTAPNYDASYLKPVTVTFDSQGGSSVDSQKITKGFNATRPVENPTKAGYIFENWYNESACTGVFDFAAKLRADTVAYANWTVNTTNVIASDKKASFGNYNVTAIHSPEDNVVQVLLEDVSNVTDTPVKFTADNTSVDEIPNVAGYNKDEIAVFEINATAYGTAKINVTVTFVNDTIATAKKENVSFYHYNTTNSAWDTTPLTFTMVQNGAEVLYTVETASFSPFGIGLFTPITYTVHFNANGGQGSMADMTFTYDVGQNLTANAFQRYNSNFLYWTTDDGTKYYNNAFVQNLTNVSGGSVTMTAQWESYSTGGSSSGTTYMGSNSASYTPTQQPTVKPTVTPTAAPTEKPATPTVIATEKPTTQATQQSPAPFVGLLAGLGAAAVLLRLRK